MFAIEADRASFSNLGKQGVFGTARGCLSEWVVISEYVGRDY